MSAVNKFLEENSLQLIKLMTMSNPFKKYLPLDKGNSKLYKNILSFSLLPVITCKDKCIGCYDLKSLRYSSVRKKRLYNTYLAVNETEKLKKLIIEQIKNSRSVEFIRIHVGGDFFSLEYVNMWAEIKMWAEENRPGLIFYTYTKTSFGAALRNLGINVVKSVLPNGDHNFNTIENLRAFMLNNKNYSICPATLKEDNIICGKTCKLCMNKQNILFVKH